MRLDTVALINSGDTVSTEFSTANMRRGHMHVPSYAAIAVFVQGSTDSTSANFFRVTDSHIASGAVWNMASASGGRVAPLHPAAMGLPRARVEFGTAATVPMSIAITGES